jgi:hypothetical protein
MRELDHSKRRVFAPLSAKESLNGERTLWIPGRNTIGPRERRAADARVALLEKLGLRDISGAAAAAWVFYDLFPEYIGDNTIDLDAADVYKGILVLSTSNYETTSLAGYANITNEHANANGYTTGGQALSGLTWTNAAGTVTFDDDGTNLVWTAAGGCMHSVLDPTTDITVSDTNPLTIQFAATGLFTLGSA